MNAKKPLTVQFNPTDLLKWKAALQWTIEDMPPMDGARKCMIELFNHLANAMGYARYNG